MRVTALVLGALLIAAFIATGFCFLRADEDLVIGAILPLTGEYAAFGGSVARGIGLGMDEINEKGGVGGRTLVIDVEDSGGLPGQGVAAARTLIEVGVPAIIGAMGSKVTMAIAPIAESSKTVLLSPSSSAPGISAAGEFIFRNYPSDALQSELMAEYAFAQGCSVAAVLTEDDTDGAMMGRAFKMTFRSLGGEIVYDERYPIGTIDFGEHVARLVEVSQECVFILGLNRDLRAFVAQARGAGIATPFYSPVIFLDEETIATSARPVQGIVFSVPTFDAGSESPHIAEFTAAYRERFDEDPSIWAAHGHDALHLIVEAIESHGTTGDEIREGLLAIQGYQGVAGETSFDANGDVRRPGRFLTIRDGELVMLED